MLAFFEGASRLALGSEAFFQRVAGGDEASWRLRWVRRHRGGAAIYYSFDEYHRTRGWALRPGLDDPRAFAGRGLRSNSRGLRGAREFAAPKPAGTQRVLVFGDSFTFGEDVGDAETFVEVLQASLPGVEVLNFGVHGYGHDQMLVYLREEAARYQPDVVVLGVVGDDMERNLLAFRDYAKPRFRLEGGRLVLEGGTIPAPAETIARERWRSKFLDIFTMLHDRRRWRSGANQEEMRSLTLAILDEFERTALAMGARPAFAYLPVHGEIGKADMAMTSRERMFFQHWRRRGVQSMYLRPFFLRRIRTGTSFKTWGHWGPLEHRTAAEGIRAYLVEKGLVRAPAAATTSSTSMPSMEAPRETTTRTSAPTGAHCRGSVGPNRHTTLAPKAAARCETPESLPT